MLSYKAQLSLFICIIRRALRASDDLARGERMGRSHYSKALSFRTTPPDPVLSPEALLGRNLVDTFSLLRDLGKLGLLSKDVDSVERVMAVFVGTCPCP